MRLIVRADALAIELIGPRQHSLVNQTSNDLPVLKDEWDFARAHLKHGARAFSTGARIAETGSRVSRVVYAKFADQRIKRDHFGCIIRGNLYGFLGRQDVEFIRIEDELVLLGS